MNDSSFFDDYFGDNYDDDNLSIKELIKIENNSETKTTNIQVNPKDRGP